MPKVRNRFAMVGDFFFWFGFKHLKPFKCYRTFATKKRGLFGTVTQDQKMSVFS